MGFSLLDFAWDADFSNAKTISEYCKKSFRKSIAKRNCAECEHPETEKRRNKGIKFADKPKAKMGRKL